MITIKHPDNNPKTVKFGDIPVGGTFIVDKSVYAKSNWHPAPSINSFNYATGLACFFEDDEQVTLVDVVVEYSLRK